MKVQIISSRQHINYFLVSALVKAFQESFASLGHQCKVLEEYASNYDVCLVMSPYMQYNFPKDKTLKIAYNFESLSHRSFRIQMNRHIVQFDCILDASAANLRFGLSIQHLLCPIGYHPSFELLPIAGPERKVGFVGYVPVLGKRRDEFKGKGYQHRAQIIAQINRELNLNISCVQAYKDIRFEVDDDLRRMIFNTDIHLNLHITPEIQIFESYRVIRLLMCNHQFVISEPSMDCPFTSGKHIVETNDIVGSIKYYLEHPQERKQIVSCGYEYIKNSYRFEDHLAKCLKQIGG